MYDFFGKRIFDCSVSLLGLILFSPFIIIGWLAAAISCRSNGFFIQSRVGQNGKVFNIIKLKTMREINCNYSSVTALNQSRITPTGKVLRKFKIDELPQLINVFIGDMSFVGPRPDVPGYADKLDGDQRQVLDMKPGITGFATLFFKDEEALLSSLDDPQTFNDEVIFPLKTHLNLYYNSEASFFTDLLIISQTITGSNNRLNVKPFSHPSECLEKLESFTNAKY